MAVGNCWYCDKFVQISIFFDNFGVKLVSLGLFLNFESTKLESNIMRTSEFGFPFVLHHRWHRSFHRHCRRRVLWRLTLRLWRALWRTAATTLQQHCRCRLRTWYFTISSWWSIGEIVGDVIVDLQCSAWMYACFTYCMMYDLLSVFIVDSVDRHGRWRFVKQSW